MYRMNRVLTWLVLVAFLVSVCQPVVSFAAAEDDDIYDAIAAANETFMELFNRNDAAGVAATYTEDGKIMPPEAEMLQGREVLRDWWQMLFDNGFVGVEVESMEVHAMGDTAVEVGQYTLYDSIGDMLEVGRYIVIWKQVDGQWLRDRNVFSSSELDETSRVAIARENGAFAQVNDIKMYYEMHGEGEPVLLMHSVTGSTAQFADVIPILAEEYQVIAVDFRGHGRTTDSGQPLSYELMTSDMVALLDQLGLDAVHIVGNKDGGIIGLVMATEYPERVKSLVTASVNWSPAGFQPWFADYVKGMTLEGWDAMAGEMYRTVAPDPSIMPVMLEKARFLLLTQPNFTLEQLSTITAPVLVLAGADEEVLKIGHVENMAAALPDASLVLIEDSGHGVLDEQFDAWMDAVRQFLRGELDAPLAGKYAAVNDIAMYYEIHGEGEPLLFMPSGMWSTENFAGLTAALAEEYQVIVMDARGRGRSTDSGRRLDIAVMADDVVALMDELDIETGHIVGWADSAIVGLDMAMRYPERVDRLVAYAPNYTVEGLTEEHRDWLKSLTLDDLLGMFEEGYARIAPNPEYLPVILERVRAMFLTEPTYTLEQLGEITAPTLVLDGEEDEFIVREHLEEMAAAIPNAELAFLPGLSHYAPFEDPVAWTDAVLAFLHEAQAAQAFPRFESSECKYPIVADANAECGYLVVAEDRSNPDSPTIRVHVIKFRSASETPAPDPIIVIPGGPGASGPFYAFLWSVLPVGDVMRAERDVYLLETRGAMYSEPAFYCPETEADAAERMGMGFAEEMDWLAEAYSACHDRLVGEGANFSAYGLPDFAGDVVDLRSALGIDQVNVYGVSYGTPPAMLLMRDDPAWVRSVILDSIIPPDAVFVESLLEGTAGVVQAVFAACAADPVCEAAYPNLDAVFSDLLVQLRQAPVTVMVTDEAGQEHVVTVDDVKFFHYVWDSTWVGDGFASLPAIVYGAAQGDLLPAAQAWLDFVSSSHSPVAAENGSWARGLTYTTTCLQEGSKTDLAAVIAAYEQADVDPTLRDWALAYQTLDYISPCEYWNVTPPESNVAIEPVTSDLPALMLTGAFDPATPPSLSRAAAERLPNSFFYELPAGHGLILTGCALDMIAQFLANPTQAPDSSCIGEMTPAWVLPKSAATSQLEAPTGYAHPEALVSAEWLADHLSDPALRILDTRDFLAQGDAAERLADYQASHIPGAVYVDARDDISDPNGAAPLLILPRGDFEALMGRLGIDNDTTVVVYDDAGNAWAARLWWALRYYGHDDVKLLDGGLTKWTLDGRPLETGMNTPAPTTFTAHLRPELLSTAEDVLQAIDDPDVAIIDSLWPEFYSGEQGFPGLRAGHIPTAVNIFVMDNLNPTDQTLLSTDELMLLWQKAGLQPGQRVITYCGAGYYGAMNLFVLYQLGYEDLSLYDGSWMEWGADPTLPVEVDASE